MAGFDISALTFSSKDNFADADLSKGQDQKTLSDGNVISVNVQNDGAQEYAVKDASGKLLKAVYVEISSGGAGSAVARKLTQVCYTTESNEYRCVNVKAGEQVTVQTVEG